MGNAHSEFIGPLAEMGILGPITFIIVIVFFYMKSAKLYYQLPNSEVKSIVFWVTLAFTTYIINGTLNNFLDTDKASVPFWSFIAIIVSIDLWKDKMLIEEKKDLQK